MSKETNENSEVMDTQENLEAVVEAVDGEVVEETSADAGTEQLNYDQLMRRLQEVQAKADEQRDQVLRMQAELENSRRRAERDVQAAHKFALEKFVNELLPVKDSLELGEAGS